MPPTISLHVDDPDAVAAQASPPAPARCSRSPISHTGYARAAWDPFGHHWLIGRPL
jgi:hypothetical protein